MVDGHWPPRYRKVTGNIRWLLVSVEKDDIKLQRTRKARVRTQHYSRCPDTIHSAGQICIVLDQFYYEISYLQGITLEMKLHFEKKNTQLFRV